MMLRRACQLLFFFILTACAVEPTAPANQAAFLGQFRLGHNITIADSIVRGAFAQDLAPAEIEALVQSAAGKRLRQYDGDGLYHLGIVVGGVALAKPGIPAVYAPEAVLIADVTVFDNLTQEPLNATPKRFTVNGRVPNPVPLIGSNYVGAPQRQMNSLAINLAEEVESWLISHPEWFQPRVGQVRQPFDTTTKVPQIDANSVSDISGAFAQQN